MRRQRFLSKFHLVVFLGLTSLPTLTGCGDKIASGTGAGEPLSNEVLTAAEAPMGLAFSDDDHELMREDLIEQRDSYLEIRKLGIENHIPPSLVFDPLPAGKTIENNTTVAPRFSDHGQVTRPDNLEELAYAPIGRLATLLRTQRITSVELTKMYIERLKRYDLDLLATVTLTEEIALRQAARADAEIRAGRYRGPLHGIPYGVKDLLAVAGTPTTWGAEPYRTQVIDQTATVVTKLEAAGAVLCVKLTLGALAWGDVWFGGTTRNPWRPEQGSSGSSAGPASAVSAGLVPFAIGTETWGSIVSPCTRCGVTGLRPTFGRVSRAGAMALSWSMDKIGPICRTVEDCAIVFDTIRGTDGLDQSLIDAPFAYRPDVDPGSLRIGYLADAFAEEYPGRELDLAVLDVLRGLGAELIPIGNGDAARVPWIQEVPVGPLAFVLSAEAAAAFDELTLSGRDDLLVRQVRYAWPNTFRAARFIPAVDYLQANRARYLLVQQMGRIMEQIDVYISPSFVGDNLLLTNLTGHPCVVVPNGFSEPDQPNSITFMGGLFDEAAVLAVAKAYQDATDFHLRQPPGFAVGTED